MSNLYPNKDELALIRTAITDAKADPAKAEIELIKGFHAGNYTMDQLDSYLVVLKSEKPDLWGATVDPAQAERDNENAALARVAFEGKGSVDARGRLVKATSEAEADKLAKQYGLTGLGDFKNVGVAPAVEDDEGEDEAAKAKAKAKSKDKDKPSTNPWSPNYRGDEAAKQAERVRIIRVMGSKAAARMSAACQVDLAGRPLRSRVA